MLIVVGKLLLRICFIFTYLISSITIAQSDFIGHYCDNDKGNYTISSTYRKKLIKETLHTLPTNGNGNGFYESTANIGDEIIYSVALCRGDVDPDLCDTCVDESISKLPQLCPNQNYAIGYNDYCMLSYTNSNDNILGSSIQLKDALYLFRRPNASEPERFNSLLTTLIDRLIGDASSGGKLRKFASGDITSPDVPTIFALVQCTPDLVKRQCQHCLNLAADFYLTYRVGPLGFRIYFPMCNLRYETYKFFNGSTLVIPTPPTVQPSLPNPPPPGKSSKIRRKMVIVVVVVLVSSLILAASIRFIIIMRKNKNQMEPENEDESADNGTPESLKYSFSIVREATNGFSEDNKLGRGGFGAVYKGVLGDGREIAVKRLARNSKQGDLEFKNEVLLLANLQNRNLVRLLGFSIEGTERLLVYEFLPNASLDQFIFDPTKRAILDWEMRYKIIIGIAKGLLYLHEDSGLRIIHRDMKPSNVLLDAELNPKIADFGMARLFTPEETQGDTSLIVGTYGYMAPEYAMHGQFSVKSDIFSFGVLVLEIIMGQNNQTFHNEESGEDFLTFAWKSWQDGASSRLIDPIMNAGAGSLPDIMRIIHIGLLCVQQNVNDRPTMASIVLLLNSFSTVTIPVPSQPRFFNSTTHPKMPPLQESNSLGSQLTIYEPSVSDIGPR